LPAVHGTHQHLGENNYFTEMCSGSEEGSYLRLIDFVYHSTLGWRVIKKKKKKTAVHGTNQHLGKVDGRDGKALLSEVERIAPLAFRV